MSPVAIRVKQEVMDVVDDKGRCTEAAEFLSLGLLDKGASSFMVLRLRAILSGQVVFKLWGPRDSGGGQLLSS